MNKPQRFSGITWIIAGLLCIAIIYLSTVKASPESHLWLFAAAFLVAIIGMKSNDRSGIHLLMLLTGTFISARYIWWRINDTLPWESQLDIPFAIALLVTEIYGITIYFLGMIVNVRQHHRETIPIDTTLPLPSIDVYIPTYNEPMNVVGPTIAAAKRMRYPGVVNVWVLDDGGTGQKINSSNINQAEEARSRAGELKTLCKELGAKYLTRADNQHAKAGNINHALTHSQGDLILILDADHVPSADFLSTTVGHFQQQPKLGFLQTPHFFVTPNPIEKNLGIEDKIPAESEMFYNRILKGMDFWNASFFCGSAAIIRREALLEVGGIATKTITEDADTAVNIHACGWDSAYINKAMIAGLSPDTFGAYVTQRSRWAQGMIQIFLLNNPIFKRGLSLSQKICYVNSTIFWFFPIFRTIYLIAPLCYLLFDLQIFVGNADDFIAFAVPHLIISMVINQSLFGKTRKTLFSEFYETILALYLLLPVLSVLVNPRKPSFTVTPKGETTTSTHFSPLAPVIMILTIIIFIAEVWGIYRIYNYPIEQGQLSIVLIFNTLNLLICFVCLYALLERRQLREEPRIICDIPARITTDNGNSQAKIFDVSLSGAKLLVNERDKFLANHSTFELTCYISTQRGKNNTKPLLKPKRFRMRVQNVSNLHNGQSVHCKLTEQNSTTLASFTELAYSQSQRWTNRRQFEEKQERNIFSSLTYFTKLALTSVYCSLLRKSQTSDVHKQHITKQQGAN